MNPTREQLHAFIKTRNASPFASNMQFHIDADECGFDAADLGVPEVSETDGITTYTWRTPHGRLIEMGGFLSLEGQP
jgi:hypothetical protein